MNISENHGPARWTSLATISGERKMPLADQKTRERRRR